MEKKIKISDIAEKAGVSLATVSRVMNQKGYVKKTTYNQVIDAAHTLGYPIPIIPPAPDRESRLLLFCVPSIGNYFYNDIFEGAKLSAERLGYQFLLYEGIISRSTLPPLIELIKSTGILGAVITNHLDKDVYFQLEEEVPIIQCCEFNDTLDRSYVSIDDAKASAEAVEYLFSLGRRHIALLNGPSQYKYSAYRLKG